jgi:peptidoglycan/xylan/chitin deacetylase (PgdA/CDA1 family)
MSFRIDRFLTVHFFNNMQSHSHGRPSVPILMYHSIADSEETSLDRPYYRTVTACSVFALHMKLLHEQGYRVINLCEAIELLRNGASDDKCAVITFDDGYADFYRNAFPELYRWGFTATVFLPTAYIGSTTMRFNGRDCLTWNEIRELRKFGISFGSHTVTHPQLTSLTVSAVTCEIVNSKTAIEDELGEPVESFAYPFAFPDQNGDFVRQLRSILARSGYEVGVSTRIGTARPDEDCFFLRRLPVNSLDDIPLFSAKLQGGYDWLYRVQYGYKTLKRWTQ